MYVPNPPIGKFTVLYTCNYIRFYCLQPIYFNLLQTQYNIIKVRFKPSNGTVNSFVYM